MSNRAVGIGHPASFCLLMSCLLAGACVGRPSISKSAEGLSDDEAAAVYTLVVHIYEATFGAADGQLNGSIDATQIHVVKGRRLSRPIRSASFSSGIVDVSDLESALRDRIASSSFVVRAAGGKKKFRITEYELEYRPVGVLSATMMVTVVPLRVTIEDVP